jgi:hypothetical protein
MPKTIWGFFLKKIDKKHERVLEQTYAEILDCLADCAVMSEFTRLHEYLLNINESPDFSFISELAENNSDYAHVDYLRKDFLIESFALVGNFKGLLGMRRTLAKKGNCHIAEHYGLYRQLVPDIIATGREIYYCVRKSWLISTKRAETKRIVLQKFSEVAAERSKAEGGSFFEEFALKHQKAVSLSFQASGFESFYDQCLLRQDKQQLLQMAESIPSLYESHIKENDWPWIVGKFSCEEEAAQVLKASVKRFKISLASGRLFLPFQPNYSLFYQAWQQQKIQRRSNDEPKELYPECCKGISYLPFGTIGGWPPAGGIYMAALMHEATKWLEELSRPWKGGIALLPHKLSTPKDS